LASRDESLVDAATVTFVRFMIACAGASFVSACSAPTFTLARAVDPWTVVEPVVESTRKGAGDRDLALGRVGFRASVCADIDLHPEAGSIDQSSLVTFLRAHGAEVRTETARSDLVYVEIRAPGAKVAIRLRVAILADADAAGVELHRALRASGRGAFGVHRGNVAVLAPRADFADVLAFASATKIACWGVLTMADDQDVFVVGGAYAEP
jgi:hypothetical protein